MDMKPLPPLELLRQLFVYNPETGDFVRLPKPLSMFTDGVRGGRNRGAVWPAWQQQAMFNSKHAGRKIARKDAFGYVSVGIDGGQYKVHRLVWFMHYGTEPKGQIDHINGIREDNRIANLRDVTFEENMVNRSLNLNNSSGAIGVRQLRSGRWRATINRDGERLSLGCYGTLEAAMSARREAERKLGFKEHHGRPHGGYKSGYLPAIAKVIDWGRGFDEGYAAALRDLA